MQGIYDGDTAIPSKAVAAPGAHRMRASPRSLRRAPSATATRYKLIFPVKSQPHSRDQAVSSLSSQVRGRHHCYYGQYVPAAALRGLGGVQGRHSASVQHHEAQRRHAGDGEAVLLQGNVIPPLLCVLFLALPALTSCRALRFGVTNASGSLPPPARSSTRRRSSGGTSTSSTPRGPSTWP
jgi:hypothetical protein